MKGLFQRGQIWWLRYSLQGHQFRVSLGTPDEREAMDKACEIIETPAIHKARLWEAELDAYLADRHAENRLSVIARTSRRAVLMAFAERYGIKSPQDVQTADVARWYADVKKGDYAVTEESAQTYVRWLRTFLAHLADKGKIVANIGEVRMARIRKTMRKPFCTADQVRELIRRAPTEELRLALYCGFHAGLRRGEIAEARPEWFDLSAGLLHVQKSATWEPKDRDDRSIPLTQEFASFLSRYGLPSPFMLPGRVVRCKRTWRYRYDFLRPFTKLTEATGLEWVTIHTMRRTFASLKVSAGVSLYKVAVWLGDMEKVVQDHYGYLLPKDSDIDRGL